MHINIRASKSIQREKDTVRQRTKRRLQMQWKYKTKIKLETYAWKEA